MSDLIDRQAAIDECYPVTVDGEVYEVVQVETLMGLPSAQPEIVKCKDCRWWDRKDGVSHVGYCYAIKHCYYSTKWEIQIYRQYREDFFCADGERRTDE